jgi:hypothetical protein
LGQTFAFWLQYWSTKLFICAGEKLSGIGLPKSFLKIDYCLELSLSCFEQRALAFFKPFLAFFVENPFYTASRQACCPRTGDGVHA